MTEEEWFATNDRALQLGTWSPRRQRLLAVAVCRALGRWIDYPAAHAALAAAEHFADTGKSKAALRRARQSMVTLREQLFDNDPNDVLRFDTSGGFALFTIQVAASENAVPGTLRHTLEALVVAEGLSDTGARRQLYPAYRDIAGPNPRLLFPPEWRIDTAVQLARTMYDSRDFSAMPILADALQDAGCDSDGILNHCRGAGPHVRGCWVVDLVLGKS